MIMKKFVKMFAFYLLITVILLNSALAADDSPNNESSLQELWQGLNETKEGIKSIWIEINEIALIPGPEGSTGPQGDVGDAGPMGPVGPQGKSAYEVAVEEEFNGTVNEWLASLIGPQGASPFVMAENDVYYNVGNVGIGTMEPTESLEVNGTVKATSFIGDGSQLTGVIPEQEDWKAPGLYNGWTNTGSGYNPAGYYKDVLGIVRLRGRMSWQDTESTYSTTIFTLPPGYRPEYQESFGRIRSPDRMRLLYILPNGNVVLPGSSCDGVSLDGITFRAAN